VSPSSRALLIALAGPALSALGLLWVIVSVTIDAGQDLTLRYVLFDPGHLVIAVGIAVSVICVPVAFQVAAAEPEELELELFEPQLDGERQPAQGATLRPAEGEAGWREAAEWE
jgi:hypothetical protein